MAPPTPPPSPERWAHFRFSVIGRLLAAPLPRGQLHAEFLNLAAKAWRHPTTGQLTHFGASTLERWYYLAVHRAADPVAVLRRKLRKDRGQQPALGASLRQVLLAQYKDHASWSYQLHFDNLAARAKADPSLGSLPSYATVRRFLKANGLVRRPRRVRADTEAALRAATRLEEREVRSYEATHVHALWHLDFHHGSRPILTASGAWAIPILLGVLDDRSRLACHAQWYLNEDTEALVHGLCQAFQKRGLPGASMMDNGSAMKAAETCEGLPRLGIAQEFTLEYSPYQNGKQENFWAQVEGRLMAMLENVRDLTLTVLNEATQAWLELEYNRKFHSEIATSPIERALAGPTAVRPCPSSDDLRRAFTTLETRTQRRSDGTLSLGARRFEVPSRYRSLSRLHVRYARWDLSTVHLVDSATGLLLDRMYPVDKAKNADGLRRRHAPPVTTGPAPAVAEGAAERPSGEIAPLLKKLMADYAATGLPPAYLPMPGRAPSDQDPVAPARPAPDPAASQPPSKENPV